ncbi:MAG: hypothetical protein K2X87_07205 [Gemmataceae bacterium]|nr:hypothetical protein [Gemmataceae bacterium]
MPTLTIDVRELPGRLAELMAAGAEVVVTDGPATAKLVPASGDPAPAGKREWRLGLHPGAMVKREDFRDPVDEDAFLRGDL